jgi:hypothetical protein
MRRSTFIPIAGLAAAAALAVAVGGSAGAAKTRAGIDPGNFVRTITNPFLPYRPGSVWVYTGVKDGQTQRDVVRVTHHTRVIMGVTTTAVSDVATHGGRVLEATTDWYAQDGQGNVWYFGEATKARNPDGTFDTSGSWLAGVKGARPGIMMTAYPQVGDAHRQEFWRGQAEDQYWLVELGAQVTVPAGSYTKAARTIEWSRLEPGVVDEKFYVPGIGVVKELAASGPREVAELAHYTAG